MKRWRNYYLLLLYFPLLLLNCFNRSIHWTDYLHYFLFPLPLFQFSSNRDFILNSFFRPFLFVIVSFYLTKIFLLFTVPLYNSIHFLPTFSLPFLSWGLFIDSPYTLLYLCFVDRININSIIHNTFYCLFPVYIFWIYFVPNFLFSLLTFIFTCALLHIGATKWTASLTIGSTNRDSFFFF